LYTSTSTAPSKYPATAEKTTLTDNLIFVISLKSEITDPLGTDVFNVLNTRDFIAFAKIL
jgi:hypothetical protein